MDQFEWRDDTDWRITLLAAAAAPDLKTSIRLPHPWFGPLDAAGWPALAAGHMGIHREQIVRILRAIAESR